MEITRNTDGRATASIPSTSLGALGGADPLTVEFLGDGDPAPAQIALAEQLASGVSVEQLLLALVLEQWNLLAEDLTDVGFETIPPNQTQELAAKVNIGHLYIHDNMDDPRGLRYGFGGEWEIDPEHGLGILMQSSTVLDVGHQDIAFTPIAPQNMLIDQIAALTVAIESKRQQLASWQAKAVAPEPEGGLDAVAMGRMLARFIAKISTQIARDESDLERLRRIVAGGGPTS